MRSLPPLLLVVIISVLFVGIAHANEAEKGVSPEVVLLAPDNDVGNHVNMGETFNDQFATTAIDDPPAATSAPITIIDNRAVLKGGEVLATNSIVAGINNNITFNIV